MIGCVSQFVGIAYSKEGSLISASWFFSIDLVVDSTYSYIFTTTGYGFYIKAACDKVMNATWKRLSDMHSIGVEATGKD